MFEDQPKNLKICRALAIDGNCLEICVVLPEYAGMKDKVVMIHSVSYVGYRATTSCIFIEE